MPSEIPAEVPEGCKITFAQVLARHGARDPTAAKTVEYRALIQKVHDHSQAYPGRYSFLEDYKYRLGADQLSIFGQQELVNLGISFYERYQTLAKESTPFIRASGQERVVQSAKNFTEGFRDARLADKQASKDDRYPYPIVVIAEGDRSNNTLNHGLCTSFETSRGRDVGWDAQRQWVHQFVPPIRDRINLALRGVDMTDSETIHFMELCPFETVASPTGQVSDFCGLFSKMEWHQFDYYQSLGKYYGFGNGHPLGPTQGVGFTNELIARLTGKPVADHTAVNHTLDESEMTFPLGKTLYADFSHDNDLTTIISALGLYNSTRPLSNRSVQTPRATDGYSASWTVPFASRVYIEKMKCNSHSEELVRVLVNDRVRPLETCGGDLLGRCFLGDFIASLSFARSGGAWDQCFV